MKPPQLPREREGEGRWMDAPSWQQRTDEHEVRQGLPYPELLRGAGLARKRTVVHFDVSHRSDMRNASPMSLLVSAEAK
jgi:hypothetical protein